MPDSFDYTTGTNSENVRLLQALIDDAPEYTEETNSRNAKILKSIINNTEYTDAPRSEIEELLLRLKAKIGGEIEVDELNVTENGTYDAGVNKAYNPVKVELPLDGKTITENGTYTASDDNLAGFNEVTVAVEGYAKKSIPNTPTPIATFNASALPMPSLTVGIEATQDLHGYDAPWVGGSGKNKCDTHGYAGIGYNGVIGTTVTFTDSTIPITVNNNVISYSVPSWGGVVFKSPSLPSGNYVFRAEVSSSVNRKTIYILDSNNVVKSAGNYSDSGGIIDVLKTLEDGDCFAIWIGSNNAVDITITNMQLEAGTSSTTFAPYENICPISGHTEANVTKAGKNLFDSNITITANYYNDNGEEITSSTTGHSALTKVKASTLYKVFIYALNSANIGGKWGVYYWDSNMNFISRNVVDYAIDYTQNAIVFTTPNNCRYISFQLPIGTSATTGGFDKTKCFLYENDTTSDFVPYSGQTYTTALKDANDQPLTCYGGELVNVNGVQTLDNTHNSFDMGSVGWGYTNNRFFTKIDDIWNNTQSRVPSDNQLMCELYKTGMYTNQPTGTVATWNGYIYVKDDSYSGDVTAFKTAVTGYKIAYELATPTEIPQDNLAIATQDGINNIWADTGDIQSGEYMEAL